MKRAPATVLAFTAVAVLYVWLAAGSLQAAAIFVDGQLPADITGSYSIAKRDDSGKDGDAYNTIGEAADRAEAGDVVAIRGGVYNTGTSKEENDVLWPKHSGRPGRPIVFRAHEGEEVVLGEKGRDYPSEEHSIGRGTVTLKGVSHVVIEGLTIRDVAGWVYGRNCSHITFRSCVFLDAHNEGKGSVKMIQCDYGRFLGCTFRNSAFDCLILNSSNHNLVQGNSFAVAAHCLLAIRGGNFNVIRGNHFTNSYYRNTRAEKLVEVYDVKADKRTPDNPAYMPEPAYDSTKYNLFEHNFYGYHPFRPNRGAQPSAMQYSGQNGIVRRNLFCNPRLSEPDPDYPDALAGGIGMNMRWGGSWGGWRQKESGGGFWDGEAIEAGYVTHNRIFNNTFFGYDNGCVTVPGANAVDRIMNPPPMEHKENSRQFHKKYEFGDNVFKNNIMMPGAFEAHINWASHQRVTGMPVALVMGSGQTGVRFERNNFFAVAEHADALIYIIEGPEYPPPNTPAHFDELHPNVFQNNLQIDPLFVDVEARDFRLRPTSPMVDAALPLTAAAGSGQKSVNLVVEDAGYFYDGFGIAGEQGDVIQLSGSKATARILKIDYTAHAITLDEPLTWKHGQGVGLAYTGAAPDIGALERVAPQEPVIPGTP
jgi:hypothetical protein